MQQEEDEGRKRRAKAREEHWELLRQSMEYLKKNESKWRTRKIEECEKIREDAKIDRLAIAREKKKRYGIKTMNKEENKRLKMRTEERLEVAQAKENYWKLYRGGGKESKGNLEEGRKKAWQHLEKGISAIEGGG